MIFKIAKNVDLAHLCIWGSIVSNTTIKKLKTFQNTALRIATDSTRDRTIQHSHDKINVLLMVTYLKLHATQLKQLTQTQARPLRDLSAYSNPPRNMKATITHNNEIINIIVSEPDITPEECRENLKHIHTTITS